MRIFVDFPVEGEAEELLRKGTAGHELVFPERVAASILHPGESDESFATADIAFGQPVVDAIKASENLRWVQLSSSGFTRYDNDSFRALMAVRGVPVCNSASVFAEGCATHTLSFMLAQARRLPEGLASQAANGSPEWAGLRGTSRSLRGETVLILGYGAIGRRLVELLAPFEMNVLAYRRKARGDEGIPVVEDLDAAFAQSEHVINILPEGPGTVGFFDAAKFRAIKPGAIFYNIGRGPTVDQDALANVLRSGHLGAAWLDVTHPEPLPADHPLRSSPNCYITPHTAGGTMDEGVLLVRHFLANFRRFQAGEPLSDRIM